MLTVPRAMLAGSRLQQLALLRAASRSRARSSTAGGGDAQATAAERLGLAVFGTMVATTLGLGTWQLMRYSWKVDVLKQRAQQLQEPPLDLSSGAGDDTLQPALLGCRRVSVTGEFDYAHEVHVTPRPPPKDAPAGAVPPTATGGFLAITPLVRPDGSRLLVHRGWVPHAGSGSAGGKGQAREGGSSSVAFQPAAGPAGRVTVTGVLREGEDPGIWAVKHYPERREFSWMELPALAAACGLPASPPARPPIFVEAIEAHAPPGSAARAAASSSSSSPRSPPLPITKQAAALADTYVMPMTHLVYGGTWFTLAACGVAITWTKFLRRRGGGGGGGRGSRAVATAAAAAPLLAAPQWQAPPRRPSL